MATSKRLLLLFAATGTVLLGSFVVLFGLGAYTVREIRVVQAHEKIIARLERSQSILKDAEIAQESFLLTANPKNLDAYNSALTGLNAEIEELAKRAKRNEIDLANFEALRKLIDEAIADLRQSVTAQQQNGIDAVLRRSKSDGSVEKMNAIRAIADRMTEIERQKMDAAQGAADRSVLSRARIFLALMLLNLLVLGWSYRRVKREATARFKAAQELEAAGKAKDQFLANLSHELRTPLTPVLATLTAWQTDSSVPQPMLADIQMLRRNVELEARLVDDLLDITRIASGKLSLNREIVDVHELLMAVVSTCGDEIKAKQITVSLLLNAKHHHAEADPARLQQVFWNVLKNAVKFTPDDGQIRIESRNDHVRMMQIEIADNGIGMSADTIARLFLPFEQGAKEITQRFGGLGLGMAISKALVDAHCGSITARSDGTGKGSTFTIHLSAVANPQPSSSILAAPMAQPETKRRLKILVVEDHEDTANVLHRLLKADGHDVYIGRSVASANEIVASQTLDLLLSDVGLPDGTGIDLLRQIREKHNMPAIAMTGYGMEDDIAKTKDAGFTAHLTKPISFEKLKAMIAAIT